MFLMKKRCFEMNKDFKCNSCHFYDKLSDRCKIKTEISECSKNVQECKDYLIKEKLVMF